MTDLIYSLMWVAGTTIAPFLFLDEVISPDVKKRLLEFLKSRPDAFDNLPRIAAQLITRVFGAIHFSFRCFFASVTASLFFLMLVYVLRILLILAAHNTASADDIYDYILGELGYPFSSTARTSFAISLVANLLFDFFGLLKTRFVIGFLTRNETSLSLIFVTVVADLVFSFVIFQMFYLAYYCVSLFFTFGPPRTILLPGGDPSSFMVIMAEIMILPSFATSLAYAPGTAMDFLTHSHAIPVILAFTFIPIFLTSVFFYASIAPSIWFWLFLFAAIVSRVLAPAWPSVLHVFNFEQSPFRVLGLVASALVLLVFTFGLFLSALGPAIISAFFN